MSEKLIPLTHGKVAIVDAEDFARVSEKKWHFKPVTRDPRKGYAACAVRKSGYASTASMHAFIMQPTEGQMIDHVNGNGLDNRRANLRIASRQQNVWNRMPTTGRDLPKGVHIKRGPYRSRPFFACIRVNDRLKHLGYFASIDEAAEAYNAAAALNFGEFARSAKGELLRIS